MLFAAIDLGTQTFRIGIAEIKGKEVLPVTSRLFNVRLGRAISLGRLTSSVLDGLKEIRAILAQYPVSRVAVCGTEAVRRLKAHFPSQFHALQAALQLPITILSPQEEGHLTALGAITALRLEGAKDPIVILDVGGGSTEAIHYSWSSVKVKSLPVGAVTFDEKRMGQLSILEVPPFKGAEMVVATGGTATTLGAMMLGLTQYAPLKIRGLCVNVSTISDWIDRLASLGIEKRESLRGLEPERADIIIPGLRILKQCLRHLDASEITISDSGLLMGILIDLIKKEFKDHAQLDWRRLYV